MIKKLLLILPFVGLGLGLSNAKPDGDDKFKTEVEKLVLQGINKIRLANKLDSLDKHEILYKAAGLQSKDMAKAGKASLENSSGKLATTGKRLQSVGGTQKAEEIVISVAIAKGKNSFKASQVADEIIKKWGNSKKEKPVILNPGSVYVAVSYNSDKDGKKGYVSAVFGSFNSFNTGVKKRKELAVRFTKKNKKLKAPDTKGCKECDKFKDFEGLKNGLYVKNNKIYLKYDNLKAFTKLMKGPADGLAVDVVQRAQYEKPDYNIYDNNLFSKGVLLKKMYSGKLLSKNLVKAEDSKKKVTSLEVCLGKLPKKLKGDYELNLIILQNNQVCKKLTSSYVEKGNQASSTPLEMILTPDSLTYCCPKFVPKAENTVLNFTIPFEKNKYDYKPEDIKPFLDALQEPDFIVDGLYIYAYSSIEGDSISNSKLQKKRAEGIVKTLQNMQSNKITTNIKTSDSWDMFKTSMTSGKYENLAKMSKKEAIREINSKGLEKELEPVLAKQRFAQIVMDITYDIKGDKEQKYSMVQFNKAVKQGDIKLAKKIQAYIVECVKNKKYTPDILTQLEIPKDAKGAELLANSVYYNYINNNKKVEAEDLVQMREILKLDPANPYLIYNALYCELKASETFDPASINATQASINKLYTSSIPKKQVDALNMEYQFKVMDAMDTVANSEAIIEASINKVKSFYNFKNASWENSLKLAYAFMEFKDYNYAVSLLEPFINEPKVSESLLHAYVSACAQNPDKIKSRGFVIAMRKIREKNPEKFCEMIGAPKLTFQVLDNPLVKEEYIKANCSK